MGTGNIGKVALIFNKGGELEFEVISEFYCENLNHEADLISLALLFCSRG